jgi:hypothetical protein
MPTSIRLLAFGVLVVVAGAVGWAAGDATGPTPPVTTVDHGGHGGESP